MGLKGDINGDGKFDKQDLEKLRNLLKKDPRDITPEESALLDVNGDGEIDYNDLIDLCKMLVEDENTPQAKVLADQFIDLRDRVRAIQP